MRSTCAIWRVVPSAIVTVAVSGIVEPLITVSAVIAFSEILTMPSCARVSTSLAWQMPSPLRSCQTTSWLKIGSEASITPLPLGASAWSCANVSIRSEPLSTRPSAPAMARKPLPAPIQAACCAVPSPVKSK